MVGREEDAPAGVSSEPGWRCLAVSGPLAFELTGVLASLAAPLAAAEVPIFALSTYATDCLLVRERDLGRAVVALEDAGHQVNEDAPDPTLELIRFIRGTLGCGCPPAVFTRIDVRLRRVELAGLPAPTSIDVGGRLLVLVVGPADAAEIGDALADVICRGREIRDARGFNRFRLVVVVSSPDVASAAEELGRRFARLVADDDRLHLHVVRPEEVPDLEFVARMEDTT